MSKLSHTLFACEHAPDENGKNSASTKQKNERSDRGGTGEPVDFVFHCVSALDDQLVTNQSMG